MVTIERLNEGHRQAVESIKLAQEQVKFAGTAQEFLADDSETTHLHIIQNQQKVVGFFKIDIAYASSYPFCPSNALGLRFFVVGIDHQGKGIGTGAVRELFHYLAQAYTDYNAVYLTVNCKNPAARACYLKGGFVDTGELYLGGAAGPQHIMRAVLRS
jgi:RimJ/RimL family protein N-acetyltransferase